jgi:hypothetical protein
MNLELLRTKIARKPSSEDADSSYPKSLDESFQRYIRTRHVNLVLANSDLLSHDFEWPFPFFYFILFSKQSMAD